MIHDPILLKLVDKQTEDFNNGVAESIRVENFKNIVKRQKELKEMNKGGD